MAGSIPKFFIDDLVNRIDIVDVIDARVPLKKKGRDYQACCPFHNEKTPSFTVSQSKQFYYCFGCGAKGNSIGFLMEYDHMEFVEAIEALANSISIEVPYETSSGAPTQYKPQKNTYEALHKTLEQCALFYQQALSQSQFALAYVKQRHISAETQQRFAIGYAPKEWQSVPGEQQLLIQSGMSIEKDDGRSYDRFRNRLMFPIRNRKGNTIAFGGRIIDPEDNPKYLNSPETDVFHKAEEIYGLYELRQTHSKIEFILVTEGYMDVVALSEHGIHCAVATLGTAINHNQIETLFRTCKTVVFCFDGDAAGQKAAQRALENSFVNLKEGRIAKFLFLPTGEDPDTFVQQYGKERFIEKVNNADTLTQFLFDSLLAKHNIKTAEGRALLLDELRPHFQQIPLQSLKDQILGLLETTLKIKLDERLLNAVGETLTKTPAPQPQALDHQWSNSRLAINLLLQNPTLALTCSPNYQWSESNIPGVPLLLEVIDAIHEDPEITPSNLLQHFQHHPNSEHLYKLAMMHPPQSEQNENAEQMFIDCQTSIQQDFAIKRNKQLINKLNAGETLTDNEHKEIAQHLIHKK
ncbi:MAG: DNA primase [Gammaproteobacteria bacterium]|nr:DNA primase [Gammaproteobacteria bacterium]